MTNLTARVTSRLDNQRGVPGYDRRVVVEVGEALGEKLPSRLCGERAKLAHEKPGNSIVG
jgi:hypothetical protein